MEDILPQHMSRDANVQMPGGEFVTVNTYLGPALAQEVRDFLNELKGKVYVTDSEAPEEKVRIRGVIYVDEEGYVGLLKV